MIVGRPRVTGIIDVSRSMAWDARRIPGSPYEQEALNAEPAGDFDGGRNNDDAVLLRSILLTPTTTPPSHLEGLGLAGCTQRTAAEVAVRRLIAGFGPEVPGGERRCAVT